MENSPIFPRYLSIQTTSFCNANCIFCPNHEVKDLFSNKVMEEVLFKKIIDECKTHRGIERIILYLNNEPLTDPCIVERINYAKEKIPWASVHILTNGSLLDEKLQDKLIESSLDWIGISMHGIKKESIEFGMGLDHGTVFPRVLNFIQKARKKRDPDNFIMVTFLKHKYMAAKESQEAVEFWKGQGINRVSFFEAPISRAGNVSSMAKTHNSRISGCKSIWANEMIHIVENGDVILCCMDWRREVILGNLNDQSIHEVWNSQKYGKIREKRDGKTCSEENFICKRCEEAIASKESSASTLDPAKIALVMVPPWQTKMPPLGLAYLSSFLRSNGIKTRVIDLNVKLYNKSQAQRKYFWDISTINNLSAAELGQNFCVEFREEINNFINEIIDSKIRIIGLSTTIASINVAIYIAHQIKARDASRLVILGGPGVFWDSLEIDPHRLVDVFVIGEGELTLLEIIKLFEKNKNISDLIGVPATIVCFKNKYHSFNTLNTIKNLDQIPMVDFSEFDLKEYNDGTGNRPLPIIISRGCINRCSFCIDHKMNGSFRIRSPEKVIEELKYYNRELGVSNFEFNDLLCNGNLRQLENICDSIVKEGLKITWGSYAVVRKDMSASLLKKLKNSGCVRLCYGIESASDVVLKKMNKTFSSEIAQQVIRDTHNSGIQTAMNIIIGHPGETEGEFKQTYDFLIRNREFIDEITNVSTCFLMKETDLIKNLDKFGIYFKKALKDYLKILTKNVIQCNYRKFYVAPDNSPHSRSRRLRRMLILISKLKIPCVIVNRVNEDDKNFNKLFQGNNIGTGLSICSGSLKIACDSDTKMAHIYFRDQRLTSDIGLNTSFEIDNKWVDSTKTNWKIKTGNGWLLIKVFFLDVKISQDWLIRLRKESLSWTVKTYFNDNFSCDQQKIGFLFSDKYDKYGLNDVSFIMPPSDQQWREIDFIKTNRISLIPRANLPVINLNLANRHVNNFAQLQNLPSELCAKMINFCSLDPVDIKRDGKNRQIFKKGDVHKQSLKFILRYE